MKLKEIWVEKKFNLGNFESLGIGVMANVEDHISDDYQKVIDDVTLELNKAVMKAAEQLRR